MSEKLKLQTNVPVEIALKYADGKPTEGEYGDSVMYSLVDGRVWFAPPICAHKIQELGIQRGELFRVCKAEVANGNRRGGIEYQISRVETAAVSAAAVEPAVPAVQAKPVQQISATSNGTHYDATVQALARCFQMAADALALSRTYNAKQHGWDTKYTEQNIISVGCSLYINAVKGAEKWAA